MERVWVFLAIAFMTVAAAQEAAVESGGIISGQIYDAETNMPLSFSSVYLDSISLGVTTGRTGKFVLKLIPPGKYRLKIERLGYEPYIEENLILSPGKLISRTIGLQPSNIQGEEVLVTATRKEQTARMAPASVVVLKARDLDDRPATTFDTAVESVPGLAVYRSAGVSVQSLSIRGSSDVAGGGVGNRVLLMIDGRPALTPDAGSAYWGFVPTNFIDRIEVVKGAFSSLYGSSAMGGVVNVITRKPAYRAETRVNVKYGFFEKAPTDIRFTDEFQSLQQVEINHSGVRGPLSYLFSAGRKSSDGHTERSAFESYDLFGKLLYDFRYNRNLEISFGGGYGENDYPHAWLNAARPLQVRAKYSDDRQEKRQYNLDLHYWAVPNSRTKYSSRFYFYNNDARSFFNDNDPDINIPFNEPFGTQTIIKGNKLGNISQVDLHLGKRHYLIAGSDIQIDNVDATPDTIVYGRQRVNNGAFYLQDEITLNEKLTATLGLRYDYHHLVGWNTLSQLSPKVALLYTASDNLALRMLFGQAFRAPTIAERFFKVELGGGVLFKPNPDLTAEKMNISLEGGLRWQPASFAEFDIALYRYEYEDQIFWKNISAEEGVNFDYFQVRNLNRALLQGSELTLRLSWNEHLQSAFSYNYLDARDLSAGREDDTLPYRPKHNFNGTITANWKQVTFNLNGRYRSAIAEVFLFETSKPDAFQVYNGKLSYQAGTNLRFSVAVNNIGNASFEELARYRMPGRHYLFGTNLTF